jgi:hypothetical protein
MDGGIVPIELIRSGIFESGIRGEMTTTKIGNVEMREPANSWANGNAHFRVRYVTVDDRLVFDSFLR